MWDSRVYWGNDGSPVSTNEVNALELVQAYAAASIPLGNKRSVSLQAGRFTLNLGSRRLVAADDYRNTTNGYTGLKADFVDGKGTSATLIYVLPQQRRPDNLDSLLANEVRPDHAGVDLVLAGHIHLAYALPLEGESPRGGGWLLQTGTAVSERVRDQVPNSFHVIMPTPLAATRCVIERFDYHWAEDAFLAVERVNIPRVR